LKCFIIVLVKKYLQLLNFVMEKTLAFDQTKKREVKNCLFIYFLNLFLVPSIGVALHRALTLNIFTRVTANPANYNRVSLKNLQQFVLRWICTDSCKDKAKSKSTVQFHPTLCKATPIDGTFCIFPKWFYI
jgi:hypothetical protein